MLLPAIRKFDQAADTLDLSFDYNNDETVSLKKLADRNSEVDICLLRRIALWKLDRVLNVPNEMINKLRGLAIDAHMELNSEATRSLLQELMECDGIGLPMASTILKFLRPDVFPIIDVRAYRALYGQKPYFNQSSVDKNVAHYLAYASTVRRIADQMKRPLSEIDEQLYCFDKEFNGKI